MWQSRPRLFGTVRRVEQEDTAGFQAFCHLVGIDKLQLMAADKIGTADQIGRVNRLFADAQMRHRQATGLFRVVDKIALSVQRRTVADDFDVVLGGGNRTVAAQAVEQCFQRGALRQGFFAERQRKAGHIVKNTDGKARARFVQRQFVKHCQRTVWPELFRGQPIATTDHHRHAGALATAEGFGQCGHHVQIQGFGQRSRLFGAVQHGDFLGALRQHAEQVLCGEWPEQSHFQYADFLTAG